MPKIIAIVVIFHPNLQRLQTQLAALAPQVDQVVIVDNGSNRDDGAVATWAQQYSVAHVHCMALACNMGIAFAQNQGIAWAQSVNASHVLLMDHDSIPAKDMVSQLMGALALLPNAGAVGACYSDPRRAKKASPFIRTVGLLQKRLDCAASGPVLEVDHVIASGCLIPMDVLARVGQMRDDFFIDFVDVEWCLRARFAGYSIHGVCTAHLEHRLGDTPVRFFGRDFPTHSPHRHYFHARNAVMLYREPWVPLNWKLVSASRLILKFGFHVLLTRPRIGHLKSIAIGLVHGFLRRAGPAP